LFKASARRRRKKYYLTIGEDSGTNPFVGRGSSGKGKEEIKTARRNKEKGKEKLFRPRRSGREKGEPVIIAVHS